MTGKNLVSGAVDLKCLPGRVLCLDCYFCLCDVGVFQQFSGAAEGSGRTERQMAGQGLNLETRK